MVAGWTAKRKPKRAVGAAEGLRCFAAARALVLARGLVARPQGAVCGCLGLPAVVLLVGVYPTGLDTLWIFIVDSGSSRRAEHSAMMLVDNGGA